MDINPDIKLELKRRDIKRDDLLKEIRYGYLWTIFQVYLVFIISSTIIVYSGVLIVNYFLPEFTKISLLDLFLISSATYLVPCYFGAKNLKSKHKDDLIIADQEFIGQITKIELETNLKSKGE